MNDTIINQVNNMSLQTVKTRIQYLYSYLAQTQFQSYLSCLNKKIRNNWEQNPEVERLNVIKEDAIQLRNYANIKFPVKVIATKKYDAPKVRKISDPFAREVCEKSYIDSLSKTHALIYNKFPLVSSHVLVITKDMESQVSPVTKNDFYAALKVMHALNGFVFFNGGAAAGSSQRHKHLQVIPYDAYPEHDIPLNALVNATGKSESYVEGIEYGKVDAFKFKHVLCKFERNFLASINSNTLEEQAKTLEAIYKESLRKLGNSNLNIAYNFILTKNWLFVVLRRSEAAMDRIKLNGVGFTGSFAVNSEEDYKFLMKQDPLDILQEVTFPE
jgi:ATP adenylyltransferase